MALWALTQFYSIIIVYGLEGPCGGKQRNLGRPPSRRWDLSNTGNTGGLKGRRCHDFSLVTGLLHLQGIGALVGDDQANGG